MKFLVIGLGSMGKRRVRNLRALGITDVSGTDTRADRRHECELKYGIRVFDDIDLAVATCCPDVFVISTPPDLHMKYAYYGHEKRINCFIEASVVGTQEIIKLQELSEKSGVIIAPSCTYRYYPGPCKIRQLIQDGLIGKLVNLNYTTGQYLPDWHPWETIKDFYVSKRETGGCREILPFELTWLNEVFGHPEPLACVKDKLTDLDAEIDDIYHCILRYPGGLLANITVEVISRPKPTREMRILGTEGTIVFSHDENCVRYICVGDEDWNITSLDKGSVEAGYINPEEPYVAEMADFIRAIDSGNRNLFPNSLERDARVLKLLNDLEELSGGTI